jgi:transposase
MPLLSADPVSVLPEQRRALEGLVRSHSTPQQLTLRARIIVLAADGMGVRACARQLGVWPKTVRYWRRRWRSAADRQSVAERLADAPRSGAPATFTPEQICALVAMTCEKPSESERPISHWSQREIADEAMRRGLIPSISQRSVGRFLKRGGPQAPLYPLLADPEA